jgi:hypothetical protein
VSHYEQVLVAIARDIALVLTGAERGETWRVEKPPGDGLWVIHRAVSPQSTERWLQWSRPSPEQLLSYQHTVSAPRS